MRKAAAEGAWSRKAQQLVPEPDHDMEEINLKIDSFEKSFPPLPAPDPSAITAPSEQTNLPRPKSPRPGLKRLANFSGGSAGRTARFNGSLNLDADDDDEDEFNNGDVRDANQNTLTPGTLTAASNPCFCADSTASELRKLMQLLCFEAADIDADDYDEREELIPKVPSVRGRSNAVSEVGSSAWRKEGRR